MTPTTSFRVGKSIFPTSSIQSIDTTHLVDLGQITVVHSQGVFILDEGDAVELLMLVKPSSLEGVRLKWLRGAWAKHNLLGHPVMQLVSWLGYPKLGIAFHENTIPRPQVRSN